MGKPLLHHFQECPYCAADNMDHRAAQAVGESYFMRLPKRRVGHAGWRALQAEFWAGWLQRLHASSEGKRAVFLPASAELLCSRFGSTAKDSFQDACFQTAPESAKGWSC